MKEIVLPSGQMVKIRDGKGRDLLNAQRKAKSTDELIYALIAELSEIDEKRLIYEDLLEMPLADVMTLIGAIGNFTPSLQGMLSPSADTQVGA